MILVRNRVQFMFPSKIPENRRKSCQKNREIQLPGVNSALRYWRLGILAPFKQCSSRRSQHLSGSLAPPPEEVPSDGYPRICLHYSSPHSRIRGWPGCPGSLYSGSLMVLHVIIWYVCMNLFCIVVYCISFFIAMYFISIVPYLVYLRLVNWNSPSHIYYSIIMICRCHVVVKYSSMSQENFFRPCHGFRLKYICPTWNLMGITNLWVILTSAQ